MSISTITSKGQTTIPIEIRKFLNLKTGDKINFFVDGTGKVGIRAKNRHISELKGILQSPSEIVVSESDIKSAVSKGMKEKFS